MRKLFYVTLATLTALVGASFSYRNAQRVDIDYYFAAPQQMELSFLLLITLTIGFLLGCFATLPIVFGARRRTKQRRADRTAPQLR